MAASRRDPPVVLGPDAKDLSREHTGNGPLVMYVGASPMRRTVRVGRKAGRNGRHVAAISADSRR